MNLGYSSRTGWDAVFAVNRVIVKFTRVGKESTSPRPDKPGPADRTLLFKRSVEDNPHCKASDRAEQIDVSLRTAVRYLHKLDYYGRAARRKPLLRPANIKRRKDLASEMVESPQAFWNTVIFSDDSRFAAFPESSRAWVWILRSKFDAKRLQPTIRDGLGSNLERWLIRAGGV
ncbi:uncharacterized protein LOC115231321 [Octopus sinensis]|uniref:Uncharacterized protein LOC115231321 n=1 Tax=Octopus sinensis TaxID=2607531 RepID=A0A6P7TZL7_9MOLL|nr:uncharacterized protein LOC115231321 [Octopus sinensis]